MRPTFWMLCTLLALAPLAFGAEEGGRTQWKLSSVSWVQRVPAEAGAPPNAHPVRFSAADLQAFLAPVLTVEDGKELPLFAKEELQDLASALSAALALAQPGEDLILLSTAKRGGGFLETPTGLTARLFMAGLGLNLIVHDTRLPFMDRYLVDKTLPTFAYGSRTKASAAVLRAPETKNRRGDWLAIPLSFAIAPPVAAAPAASPAPAPPAKPAPEPALAPRDAAFYEAQTLRLKALKRLRDEHLLSEAEYTDKREAILKTL